MNQTSEGRLHARYMLDLSFENPGAPDSFGVAEPEIGVEVQIDGRTGESLHEVVLTLTVTARHDSMVLWLAEVSYVGLFEAPDVEEAAQRRFLYVDAPSMLFPWADRIIADVVRDGGLSTLTLSPPDFDALYRQRKDGG